MRVDLEEEEIKELIDIILEHRNLATAETNYTWFVSEERLDISKTILNKLEGLTNNG